MVDRIQEDTQDDTDDEGYGLAHVRPCFGRPNGS